MLSSPAPKGAPHLPITSGDIAAEQDDDEITLFHNTQQQFSPKLDELELALPSGPLGEEDDDFDSDAQSDIDIDVIRDISISSININSNIHTDTDDDEDDAPVHVPVIRAAEIYNENATDNNSNNNSPISSPRQERKQHIDATNSPSMPPQTNNNNNSTTKIVSADKPKASPATVPKHRRKNSRGRNSYSKLPKCNDADEFYLQSSSSEDEQDVQGKLLRNSLPYPTSSGGVSAIHPKTKSHHPNISSSSSKSLVASRLKKGFKAVKRASAKSTASAGKSLSAAWKASGSVSSSDPKKVCVNAQNSADREEWLNHIIPAFKKRRRAARTRTLMFRGIPSSVRGEVWKYALGNPLNVTKELYEVLKERALQGRKEYEEEDNGNLLEHQRSAHKSIILDLPRTFPNLTFFHADGSTYEDALRDILEAFVYLRPDVGYSQGMSFLAAVLLLFMDPPDAFCCFVNMLLYKSCFLQFFRIQMPDVRIYLDVHNRLLADECPALHAHFAKHSIEADIYMINWVMTLFCHALPLDLVSRIWDIYVFDGDIAIFRTALGILKLLQSRLLASNFEEIAYCLSHLPVDEINDDQLMRSIRSVRVVTKKKFKEVYRECQTKYVETATTTGDGVHNSNKKKTNNNNNNGNGYSSNSNSNSNSYINGKN